MDVKTLEPSERPAMIVACRTDDPQHVTSAGQVLYWCDRCGEDVWLDIESVKLLPLPVFCVPCFATAPRGWALRRAGG